MDVEKRLDELASGQKKLIERWHEFESESQKIRSRIISDLVGYPTHEPPRPGHVFRLLNEIGDITSKHAAQIADAKEQLTDHQHRLTTVEASRNSWKKWALAIVAPLIVGIVLIVAQRISDGRFENIERQLEQLAPLEGSHR